jgi:hypothetical protein
MMTIESAIVLATTAMRGLKDLEGNPAVLHPLRVMLSGESDDEKIVGVLHDVVEDTSYTLSQLKQIGCTDEQIEALRLLTHTEGVPYFDYVERIATSGNRLAIVTKLHDLEDNLIRGRKYKHWKIVAKHERALQMIQEAVK